MTVDNKTNETKLEDIILECSICGKLYANDKKNTIIQKDYDGNLICLFCAYDKKCKEQ